MTTAEIIECIAQLLAGLGVFLIGVKLLSDNVEKLANDNIRKLFGKASKNKLIGVGVGTVTTALVQSSSLTTVMVVGLVNAGVMTLYQATTVIMGANIGTTITAHIASLNSLSISTYLMVLACIGIFITIFSKNEKVRIVGEGIAGLGLIFVGLEYMSTAMSSFRESPVVKDMLTSVGNPFLLLLIGIVFTALIQSSSAVTAILIAMAGGGLVIGTGGNSILYVILGTNIGTCVTALLSSVGATTNGKRAAVIHLMFNVFGSVIFLILLLCWPSFMDMTFASWFGNVSTQIAMFHTFFNVLCTAIFLPMTKWFVKLSELIVRNTKKSKKTTSLPLLDKRLIGTPNVAIQNARGQAAIMLDMAMQSLDTAMSGFNEYTTAQTPQVLKSNDKIIDMSQQLSDYLISISAADITLTDEKRVLDLQHNIGDIVRISELAENITKYTDRAVKESLTFSEAVHVQIKEMKALLDQLADTVKKCFNADANISEIAQIADKLEQEVDDKRKSIINDHITRLNNGSCKVENSRVFINLVSNLERIGDHLTFITHASYQQ